MVDKQFIVVLVTIFVQEFKVSLSLQGSTPRSTGKEAQKSGHVEGYIAATKAPSLPTKCS